MKIISFSQQGSRAICILSANGAISNVTLRQPNSSGGTLTYEVLLLSFSSIDFFMQVSCIQCSEDQWMHFSCYFVTCSSVLTFNSCI